LGKACSMAIIDLAKNGTKMTKLRDKLIDGVLSEIDESYLNGDRTNRLPNNANFRFAGIEGESLVLHLDAKGIAASTGSACSSKTLEPSHVLRALGLEDVDSHGSLRLSLGKENKLEDIKYTITSIKEAVETLRKLSPLWCSTENI
ncbi:MAG: aminotransferase class V-fold PLP-dependent enzyme, partial [Methanobacteriaceae archaeon]|nr:aminotransferase class V-fold PLP-dependent enzyme [Methanobacteriaceae archaeon]